MRRAVLQIVLLYATALFACDRPDRLRPDASAAAVAPGAADTVAIYRADEDRPILPANRIYYTLTDHGWYARGEPLMHDGQAYELAGLPVAAGADVMQLAGEYGGVEYYHRTTDSPTRLYVPVFEGYWLPFASDTTASPRTVPGAAGRAVAEPGGL